MHCFRLASLLALTALAFGFDAEASLGIFEHGNGIVSLGMGGVAYSYAQETMALAANPAHAFSLGNRFDIGVDVMVPMAGGRYVGNALGADTFYGSTSKRYYFIPQGGYSRALSERWAIGFTMLNAGVGPDYPVSPYQRFGGAKSTALVFASSSLVSALAYQISPGQSLGFSLNPGFESLKVRGLGFLAALSESPDRVSDRGHDGAFSLGFGLGWEGRLTPWLSAGIGYRSKNWTQRHHKYAGLLPDHGKLELPAIFGGGVSLTPAPGWKVVMELQRFDYGGSIAAHNGLAKLSQGHLLGSADGPGFGWRSENVYKLGLAWDATQRLTLRAGFLYGTEIMNPSDTLFGFMAPVPVTSQYSAGATYRFGSWDLSGCAFNAPRKWEAGRGSIPQAFGGGEANTVLHVFGAGLSLGHRFGEGTRRAPGAD